MKHALLLLLMFTVRNVANADDGAPGFSLIEHGVTVGFGINALVPLEGDHGLLLDPVHPGFVGYVLFVPTYWTSMGDISRKWCAKAWQGSSWESAQELVDKRAKSKTVAAIRQEVLALLRTPGKAPRRGWEPLWGEFTEAVNSHKEELEKRKKTTRKSFTNTDDTLSKYIDEEFQPFVQDLVTLVSGWRLGYPADCGANWFSFYVGAAAGQSVGGSHSSTDANGKTNIAVKAEFELGFTFGLGITINQAFTILLGLANQGVTYSAAGTQHQESIWSATVGIGGNLDTLFKLLK